MIPIEIAMAEKGHTLSLELHVGVQSTFLFIGKNIMSVELAKNEVFFWRSPRNGKKVYEEINCM